MTENVLQISALQKSFLSGRKTIEVLRGVDLSVAKGESLSIRGESGCGKTTLLNLIAGLERPDAGRIHWAGVDVTQETNDSLAHRRSRYLGMVFQSYFLVPELNALDNVILAARIGRQPMQHARQRAIALLEKVGLGERLDSTTMTLSGGERQRVAVARALINQPALVLADEPTGNLDERSSEEVLELLLAVTREEGASLILVTHNPAHAQRTDCQTLLHNGVLEAG